MSFARLLGDGRYKDSDGGDAGCLYKKPAIFPTIFFIRAAFVNKISAQMSHPELKYMGKSLKQFYITTGIGLAYQGDFSVDIYNIQKPSVETVIPDYTHDYFTKYLLQRKVNAKKAAKPDKTLAKLIQSVREKKAEESTEKVLTAEEKLQAMRDAIQDPIRTFRLPYQITCVAYQGGEEER